MGNCKENKYLTLLKNPKRTSLQFLWNRFPQTAWHRLSRRSQEAGIDGLYFVLSFDCDTKEDADVVLDLDSRLREMGVRPVYAVPGSFLESQSGTYQQLLSRGAEFLNHGYQPHTRWNEGLNRYESCYFYHELSLEKVIEDVTLGDRAIQKVLGVKPLGYRTPHFGTFQTESQLQFLYAELKNLGYRFSSSTVPINAVKLGSRYKEMEITEFPVSGMFSSPLTIQDSWAFFAAPDRTYSGSDYVMEAKKFASFARQNSLSGILNYYADPSHVWNEPMFFEGVRAWSEVGRSATFGELLNP